MKHLLVVGMALFFAACASEPVCIKVTSLDECVVMSGPSDSPEVIYVIVSP